MLQHIQQYWLDWLFGVIVTVLAVGYKSLWSKVIAIKKENNGVKNGMKALLHNNIIAMGKELTDQGYCTPEEFEEFEYLYTPYHEDLGGNGSAERMREKVMRLPPNPEDSE